ncbi:MAG: cytochrome c nitrite reductase small subunit [Trueperella sp.]|nr:cytochrome c nitrite reductase small subunit [Trueperella sp.]
MALRTIWGHVKNALSAVFAGKLGIALAVAMGLLAGVGVTTLQAAGFTSYFGNDPQTCNSCHAMNEQYNAYIKGSHADVATCNDCHAPHNNIVYKYINKAENGFMHSLKFTLDNYPENIKIREHNRQVTEDSCRYCHSDMVDDITHGVAVKDEKMSCIKCHDGVGHMR